jgi:hypothetical protein
MSNVEPTGEGCIYKITNGCWRRTKSHDALSRSILPRKAAMARGLIPKGIQNDFAGKRGCMNAARNCLACFWGVAAFCSLCYGILYRSADSLLLSAALIPSSVVSILWIIDRATLERRIKRLEARSEIADERRITTQSDLSEFEHKLEEVQTRMACAERLQGSGG